MKYLYIYIIVAPFLFYIAFIVGKVIYAVKFSGMPEVKHGEGEKMFGEGKKLRYIAAGDSLAIGVGASSVENTFTHKIAEALGENYGVIYKNVAVRGAKTNDVIENQLPEIISFNPDIVVMTVGGNDAVRFGIVINVINVGAGDLPHLKMRQVDPGATVGMAGVR